jgi:hypothetical protein
MTREEKLDFMARLFMYGAKVGYDADITEVEYFIRSVADDMGFNTEGILTSSHVDERGELKDSEESVMAEYKRELLARNP